MENLVLLCNGCNQAKSKEESRRANERMRIEAEELGMTLGDYEKFKAGFK